MRTRNISHIVALLGSVSAFGYNSATAQNTQGDQNEEDINLEEIVVTGSHIRRSSSFESKAPIQVIDSSTLARIGASQPVDVLKTLTVNSGSGLYNETNAQAGTVQFNIRGLGFGSTLSLLNGRRAGIAPVADASGTDYLDINQFPVLMIERIDVLTDGASATYGSQAVAGVANIITRKGFEGFELQSDYRNASNESWSVSTAVGHAFEKGHFNLYATYYGQTRNDRTDFPWLVERIDGDGDLSNSRLISSTGSPGSYFLATDDGDGGLTRTGTRFGDPDCLAAGGVLRNPDGGTDELCRYHFADQVSVIGGEERLQVFTEFDWEFNDSIKYYNESSWSRNVITRSQGGSTFNTGNATGGGFIIPGDHPFNFFIEDPANAGNLVYIGPDDWDPAIHTGVDLICQCRPFGAEANGPNADAFAEIYGDQSIRRQFTYVRMMNGFEIELPNDWFGDISYSYAEGTRTTTSGFNYRSDIFNQLVADGDYNPFGTRLATPGLISPKDGTSDAFNDPLTVQQFNGTSLSTARSTEHVIDALVTGDLFETGLGMIGVAFGGQYRKASITDVPNPLSSAGEANEESLSFTIEGEQDVYAVFAEAIVPLKEIGELQLAVRREDYGGNVGSTTDPKISLELRPTDWLSLRSSWGTSFQAPTVRQTATASSSAFINDPASPGVGPANAVCTDLGLSNNIVVSVVGSPDLQPQSANSINLGFVVQTPQGFSFSVDAWQYDYTDLIAQSEGAQAIVNNDCDDDGIANDSRVIRDAGGQLRQVNTQFVNIGEVKTSGLDFAMRYDYDAGDIGRFVFDGKASWVNKFQVDTTGDGVRDFDGVGSRNSRNSFAPIPEWRGNVSASWFNDIHYANVTLRYIDGYLNDNSNNAPVSSMTTIDMQYTVTLPELLGENDTTLTVGANNIFDVDPPELARHDSNGNLITRADNPISFIDRPSYDDRVGHDIRGRVIYVRMKQSF